MCTSNPPFCPFNQCHCTNLADPPPNLVPLVNHEPACCESTDDRFVFFSEADKIMRLNDITGELIECYDLAGGSPRDIVIDQTGDMYIADPLQASVFRGNVDCDQDAFETIASYFTNSPIDAPTGLAISNGVLFVSGHTSVWTLEFDIAGNLFRILPTPITIRFSSDITVDSNGDLLFVENDASIKHFDVETGTVTTVLAVHDHRIPDIRGVTINSCGLFLTATDGNQVFGCSDPTDGTTCAPICLFAGLDALSCENLRDPSGIASGCCCDVYVTNPGNGNLVKFEADGAAPGTLSGSVIASGLNHPFGVTVYVPQTAGVCFSNAFC